MASSSEKILQCLQLARQLTMTKSSQVACFKEIAEQLEKLTISLNSKKLSIQIFSRFSPLSQGLYNFFNSNQALQQFYQAKVSNFPSLPITTPSDLPPAILLKANSVTGLQETRYELSANSNILIGRDSQRLSPDARSHNAQLITLSSYNKVSSVHAQIQPVTSLGSTSTDWQICDLNSTNGTYVNGQRISGCKILQPGDSITLAYASAIEKTPELIFQSSSHLFTSNTQSINLIDCDLVCLVVASAQLLSDEEKKVIDVISKAQIAGLFIMVDVTGVNEQTHQKLNTDLAELQNWLKVQYPLLVNSTFITSQEIYPFHSNETLASLSPSGRQGLEQFSQSVLMGLAKSKYQEIMTNRVNQISLKIFAHILIIEQFFAVQEQALKEDIERTAKLFNNRSLEDWKEQVRRLLKQVLEEREDFFRQARIELSQAKNNLLNRIIPNNFSQRIEDYIDILQPIVIRQKGQVCLQLRPEENSDTHEALIQFCQSQIIQWTSEEWKRFVQVYNSGGLNQLLQNSYNTVNIFPSLTLSNSFIPPASQVDVRNSLQGSFVEIQNNNSYDEGSGDLIGTVAKFGTQAVIVAGMTFLNPTSAVIQGANLVTGLTSFRGGHLKNSQVQKLKLEQQVTALKRMASEHYKAIAAYMLDRVIRDLSTAIDLEDRKFKKAVEAAEKQITDYFNEIRTAQEAYRVRQQNLNQEKAALEQIKKLAVG